MLEGFYVEKEFVDVVSDFNKFYFADVGEVFIGNGGVDEGVDELGRGGRGGLGVGAGGEGVAEHGWGWELNYNLD